MADAPRKPKVVSVEMRPSWPSTMDERIEAVWELTMHCYSWQLNGGEVPRLRRSIALVRRPRR